MDTLIQLLPRLRQSEPVSFIVSASLDLSKARSQRPDPEDDLSHHVLFCNAADGGIPRIYRYAPVVSHDEEPFFRHLIGQVDIAVAEGQVCYVGFVQFFMIDIDCAVLVDVNPVAGLWNDQVKLKR